MKSTNKTYFSSTLVLLLAWLVCLVSVPATAQQKWAWRVDQEHSVARLSLGALPEALEVGIARVGGAALLNPANPSSVHLQWTIPGNEPHPAQYSEITFTSKRSWVGPDGSLSVAGDLSVTRVVHSVQMDPNEGYSGAQYGEQTASTNTREVTLVFPREKSSSGADRALKLSGSITVNAEDFPLLQTALQSGDWPGVRVEDNQVAPLSTIGEDYAGFPSTGTVLTTATNSVASGADEGYSGFQPAVKPDTRKSTIALDLKFTRSVTVFSGAVTSSGN